MKKTPIANNSNMEMEHVNLNGENVVIAILSIMDFLDF